MFELSYQSSRNWRAELPPGLHRLVLPDQDVLQPALVDAVLRGQSSALTLPGLGVGGHILLPQSGGLISNLRLWENIALPRWYHGAGVGEEQEQRLLDWVRRLLPHVNDATAWLHQTVGQAQPEDLALAGMLRALLAAAPCIWIEADWRGSLSSVEVQLSMLILNEVLAGQQRLALVYAPDAQALNAMMAWQLEALEIDWMAT